MTAFASAPYRSAPWLPVSLVTAVLLVVAACSGDQAKRPPVPFEVARTDTLETRPRTQVDQWVTVADTTSTKTLNQILRYQYHDIRRGSYRYHSAPTNIFIYIFPDSVRSLYGRQDWLAMLIKEPDKPPHIRHSSP